MFLLLRITMYMALINLCLPQLFFVYIVFLQYISSNIGYSGEEGKNKIQFKKAGICKLWIKGKNKGETDGINGMGNW